MKKDYQKIKVLYAPRSMGILLLQLMALAPLSMALMIIFVVATSYRPIIFSDFAILSAGFILPGFLVGFVMIYCSHKYRTRLIFEYDTNILHKIKKGAASQQFILDDVKVIVSKTKKTIPGCKYCLTIENSPEQSTTIFEEDTAYGAKHWEAFAEKLSYITRLPLKKEYYLEQFDGTLLMKSLDKRTVDRRHNLIILSIPLIISMIGAVIYRIYGTSRVFYFVGCVTVSVNIWLSFIYCFIFREKLGSLANNKFILIVYIFTLLIPYALYYLFFNWLLVGFLWPLGI